MNDSNIKEIQEDSNSKIQSMIQTDFDSKLLIRTQPCLVAILFVIMISDIDEIVKMCIIRSFADDTRVNKKIKTNED